MSLASCLCEGSEQLCGAALGIRVREHALEREGRAARDDGLGLVGHDDVGAESPRCSANTPIRCGLKVSGPPSKMTGGWMSRPCARPPSVCLATAWNVESAMSSLAAPWLMSGWMSVFANTPQRPEML